jgi:hypothetical protein
MKTCFVVMSIGAIPGVISEQDLRHRYDDLIREALLKAAPSLDVIRADDVGVPGTINTDIMTRIMHSDLVVADITYPNPNVFYELGLRHASRSGTILIKERDGKVPPFDVQSLRHIAYDNTATGLKQLAEDLRKQIEWLVRNPGKPDSAFLELAHFTKYKYPTTAPENTEGMSKQVDIMMRIIANPKVAAIMQAAQATGGQMNFDQLQELMAIDPALMQDLIMLMTQQGTIALTKKA